MKVAISGVWNLDFPYAGISKSQEFIDCLERTLWEVLGMKTGDIIEIKITHPEH